MIHENFIYSSEIHVQPAAELCKEENVSFYPVIFESPEIKYQNTYYTPATIH